MHILICIYFTEGLNQSGQFRVSHTETEITNNGRKGEEGQVGWHG